MPERVAAVPLVAAPDPITLALHAEAWLVRAAPTLKRSTRVLYAAVVRSDLLPLFGDVALAHVTRGMIRRGLDELRPRAASSSSLIRARAVLGRIFEDALERELVQTNPVRDVKPVRRHTVRRLVIPTAEELARVRAAIPSEVNPERQMLFRILDATAIRIGEAQVLRPTDYDPRTRRLRVGGTIYRGTLAPGDARDDTPKGSVERYVDVPDSLARDLPGFLAARQEAEWLFPGRFGDPITYPPLAEDMKRIADKAGVPGMTPHSFRHARISLWIAEGADLEWVRRQAGHHSIAFTLRTYGKWMPMREQAVLRDLPVRRDGADETRDEM